MTAAELMSSSFQCKLRMVTAELIDRHFIIGSWWLNSELSFSGSLISSFTKVQNVFSLSQEWQLSLLSNSYVYSLSPQGELT